jgi:vanillate O-demethylase ferredoxin subunit
MTARHTNEARRVRVESMRREAIDVLAFDLLPADGRPLASSEPGAHIDVHVPDGPVRQYSLCGDLRGTERYTIAVKREANGRGGSAAMHERVAVGSVLAIVGPRNNFPLAQDARRSLFVAGGIGITPIHAMIHALHAADRDWELHYCARSEGHAAFYRDLRALAPGRVHAYFSEEPILDVATLTRNQTPDTHLYCCGPKGLMTAVGEATAHWAPGHVHFEWFSAPGGEAAPNQAFEVELRRSGMTLTVPPDRSILQVLRDHGLDVPSSCEEGVCGTCETRVLAGEPEHRDMLLSPAERAANSTMMICISRARSGRLVLDL